MLTVLSCNTHAARRVVRAAMRSAD